MKEFDSENNCSDDGLVNFLQTYSSLPPSETKPCEDLIMRSITASNIEPHAKVKKRQAKQLFWLLPITLVSSLIMVFNHLWQQKLSPQIVVDYEEDIHTFMVNSWQDSIVIPNEQVISNEQQDSLYLVVTSD